MIDLHCHYLPGVDDGPRTPAESLDLVRAAVSSGISAAIVTPHIYPGVWDNSKESLTPLLARLRDAIAADGLAFEIALGAEIRLHPDVLAPILERRAPLLGRLDGADIVLLEFPDGMIPPGALRACEKLMDGGVRPMLAHPERNKAVMRDPERIVPFVDAGCLLQLTAASVIGEFGRQAFDAAHRLLSRGLVRVVATDSHNLRSRPPRLREARDALARGYGRGLAYRLTEETPGQIVTGRSEWH